MLHYPSLARNPAAVEGVELKIQPISWTANVQPADLVSMRLNFPSGHKLERLAPKRLLYSYFAQDVNFAFGTIPKVSM